MEKFKVGDRVKMLKNCGVQKVGNIYTMTMIDGSLYASEDGIHGCSCPGNFKLITPKPKFKVGDRVRGLKCDIEGFEGIIDEILSMGYKIRLTKNTKNRNYSNWIIGEICPTISFWESSPNILELITNEPTNSSENKVGNIMSNIKNYVKNLALSADEKLLRKYGFKNDCGEYTDEALDAVEQKIAKENEAYLIEIAQGLEKEEKDNK